MDNPDNETDKVMSEGEMIANYAKSDGWHYVKDTFTAEIMSLQSILTLTGKTPEERDREIAARSMAIEILMELMRKVEGRASQHEGNKLLSEKPNTDIVTTY